MKKITALTLIKSFSPNRKIIVFSSEPKAVFDEVSDFIHRHSYLSKLKRENLEISTKQKSVIVFYKLNDPDLLRFRGMRGDVLLVEGNKKNAHNIEETILPFLSARRDILFLDKVASEYDGIIEEFWINEYMLELIFTDE